MKPELLTIGRFCLCAVDVLMLDIFLKFMFERRVGRIGLLVCFLAATVFVFIENAFGNTILNLMLVPVCSLLYALLVL